MTIAEILRANFCALMVSALTSKVQIVERLPVFLDKSPLKALTPDHQLIRETSNTRFFEQQPFHLT